MSSKTKLTAQEGLCSVRKLMNKSLAERFKSEPNWNLNEYKEYSNNLFNQFNRPDIETVMKVSNLKQQTGTSSVEELNHKTFGQIKIPTAAYNECLTGLKRWNFRKKGYYLFGPPGMGKSMLMKAFRKDLYDRNLLNGKKFQFFSAPMLFKNLKEFEKKVTRNGFERSMSEFAMDRCISADILVIDDLGTKGKPTDFEIENLFTILDQRIESMRAKGTFITSNLDINTLGKIYGDRILDRILGLMEPRHLHNGGKSFRRY